MISIIGQEKRLSISCILVVLILLSGCEGVTGTGIISGTAAIGSPLGNSEVILRDKSGTVIRTQTDADGKYKFDVKQLAAPFLIRALVADNTVIYTVAVESGINNINPFTDVAARNWFLSNSRDIDSEFDQQDTLVDPPTEKHINAIVKALINLLSVTYQAFGLEEEFNFLTDDFDADSTGFDLLLDNTDIQSTANTLTISVTIPNSSTTITVIVNFDLSTDLSDDKTVNPSKPQGLSVAGASLTSVQVLWNASRDNIGVTSYNIYRRLEDGGQYEQIANSLFPSYSDTDVISPNTYCYQVEALDAYGNVSPKSDEVCGGPLQESVPNDSTAGSGASIPLGSSITLSPLTAIDVQTFSYSWLLFVKPLDSQYEISDSDKSEPEFMFTPDSQGDYGFELSITEVSSGTITTEITNINVIPNSM